jgi:hypothetical protein
MRRYGALGRGALGAAFSIGPGYEPQPPGLQARYDRVAGYYLDLRQKAAAELKPRVTGRGQLVEPGPTTTAQLALGLHERWLAGEGQALAPCLDAASHLLGRAERSDRALFWWNDVDVPKYQQQGPLLSCMPQGQAASAFVRVYLATKDESWADAALAAIRPLVGGGQRGLVVETPAGPVLEEATTTPPSHILNGWVFALWGLWDVATGLGDPPARASFDASSAALSALLPSYDVGWWTRYSLFPPVAPDLAKPFYHRIHAAQMRPLFEMTRDSVFQEAGARWKRYDTGIARARAVFAKAPEVVRQAWLGGLEV